MANQILVSTTGTPALVVFSDLGEFSLAHPKVDFDMLEINTGGGFTLEDIQYSTDFKAAIDASAITVTDENGVPITDPLSFFNSDNKVAISGADISPSVLEDKLEAVAGKITITKLNSGADESLQLGLDANIFDKTVDDSDDISEGTVNKFVSSNQKAGLDAANAPSAINKFLVDSDKAVAQFNAAKIAGATVDLTGIQDTNILVYNQTLNTFGPATFSSGSAAGWSLTGTTISFTSPTYKLVLGTGSADEILNVYGNLKVTGTVDGRDVSVDGAALDQVISDVANLDKTDIGLGNVDNVQQIPLTEKGAANGVATLDALGKVPLSQLPDDALNGLEYLGTWDADTNSPTIPTAASGNAGSYYKVSVAGNTVIDGNTDWQVGDLIISNGSQWDKVDNTESVQSVAGKTGAVTLEASDITDFDVEVSNNADVGANTTHRTATNNPHSVTADQVGRSTAQWNANKIQDKDVDTGAPVDQDILIFDATNDKYKHLDPTVALANIGGFNESVGKRGNQNNGFLRTNDGAFTNVSPLNVPYDCTLEDITATCSSADNEWLIEVRKNGSATPVASLVVLASDTQKAGSFSTAFVAGDKISIYLRKGVAGAGTGSNIPDPRVNLFFKQAKPDISAL